MRERRPVLLDAFCGLGGAGWGYYLAGFDVYGVDIEPQPHYPFPFLQAEAVSFIADHGWRFQAIHASPPCQAYSVATPRGTAKDHPRLIEPVRELLTSIAHPWVIENVPGAPLVNPLTLCGAEFDCAAVDKDGTPLVLKRHRNFESNVPLVGNGGCKCDEYRRKRYQVAGVSGGGVTDWRQGGTRSHHRMSTVRGGYRPDTATRRALMGIWWGRCGGTEQAIPPKYTEHIGRQLKAAIS